MTCIFANLPNMFHVQIINIYKKINVKFSYIKNEKNKIKCKLFCLASGVQICTEIHDTCLTSEEFSFFSFFDSFYFLLVIQAISIQGCAFQNCTSLIYIHFPTTSKNIRYRSFWGCASLTSWTVPWSIDCIKEACEVFFTKVKLFYGKLENLVKNNLLYYKHEKIKISIILLIKWQYLCSNYWWYNSNDIRVMFNTTRSRYYKKKWTNRRSFSFNWQEIS